MLHGLLKLPNLVMLVKQEFVISQKHGSRGFWWIATKVHNKGKSTFPTLLSCHQLLSSASNKAKLFAEIFSENFHLDYLSITLTAFPSRTYLKLSNITGTPKMVKNVMTDPDLGLLITSRNVAFFLIFSIVSGRLVELKIFCKFYLIELLDLFGAPQLDIMYPGLLTVFCTFVFFTSSSTIEFQVGFLSLFFHFFVIYGSRFFGIFVRVSHHTSVSQGSILGHLFFPTIYQWSSW